MKRNYTCGSSAKFAPPVMEDPVEVEPVTVDDERSGTVLGGVSRAKVTSRDEQRSALKRAPMFVLVPGRIVATLETAV